MAYLGDIRENSIGLNGELWESDNRIEERSYWNGAYIDLCDLPAEEYSKTIFTTNGSTSEDKPTIKNKPMTLEIVDGDVVVTYSGAIVSDLYVSVSYDGGAVKTIKLSVGTVGASGIAFGLNGVTSIDAYGIGGTEADAVNEKKTFQDEEFKYQINYIKPDNNPMAYNLALMKGEIETLSNDELINKLKKATSIPMVDKSGSEVFVADIKPIAVVGLADMNPLQMTEALIANAQDIVIISDKPIIDILAASTNDSIIDGWKKKSGKITMNGVSYEIWYKTANDTELSAIYDPSVSDAIISIPQDSITFVIKY